MPPLDFAPPAHEVASAEHDLQVRHASQEAGTYAGRHRVYNDVVIVITGGNCFVKVCQ